ncbi:homeobox protein siamois-like [Microcaecilia unicolor]|uniref:Homeobox protein siamois n=1 Tax=Microcaecilia unicolor TaxID=1415580 RepID=A0A6P7WGC9_9AMPH|nr:homeobox protein siamois-like [Microcaecilia unicolor]
MKDLRSWLSNRYHLPIFFVGDASEPDTAAGAQSSSDLAEFRAGGRTRKRSSFSREQIRFLLRSFELNPYPDYLGRACISQLTGIPESRVQVWFQNRRARHLPRTRKSDPDELPQNPQDSFFTARDHEEEEEEELEHEDHLPMSPQFIKVEAPQPADPFLWAGGSSRSGQPLVLGNLQCCAKPDLQFLRSCPSAAGWPMVVHFRSHLSI